MDRQQKMKTPRFGELLDIAWSKHGLKRVTTSIVQLPNESNRWTTIVHATVETERGEWSAIGDANPENASKMIAPHAVRMAESRAIARALRWATNTGEVADVEMGGSDDDEQPAPRTNGQPPAAPASSSRSPAPPLQPASQDPARTAEATEARAIARDLHRRMRAINPQTRVELPAEDDPPNVWTSFIDTWGPAVAEAEQKRAASAGRAAKAEKAVR
jgi:hypothetical protein